MFDEKNSRLYSLIIPVYNRPQELNELLYSLTKQEKAADFEVLVIDDGSSERSQEVVSKYQDILDIRYFYKVKKGAGESRNFGMKEAKGDYFIVLDSDCTVTRFYIKEVDAQLNKKYTDAFGGPDTAHDSFTPIQKAINYAMTSILTTGGIRGQEKTIGQFQPRSFNMGISRKAFKATKGFSSMSYGEDIDMTFRLWEQGFKTQLIPKAFVYHKRKNTFGEFFKQAFKFGAARPILNKKFSSKVKITYWFPLVFVSVFIIAILATIFGRFFLLILILFYYLLNFTVSLYKNKSIYIAALSCIALTTQFFGYGLGFLKSYIYIIRGKTN